MRLRDTVWKNDRVTELLLWMDYPITNYVSRLVDMAETISSGPLRAFHRFYFFDVPFLILVPRRIWSLRDRVPSR